MFFQELGASYTTSYQKDVERMELENMGHAALTQSDPFRFDGYNHQKIMFPFENFNHCQLWAAAHLSISVILRTFLNITFSIISQFYWQTYVKKAEVFMDYQRNL